MAKTWILDTETKGTGAHVVPLGEATERPSTREDLAIVQLERPARAAEPVEPAGPMKFKVVDVRSSQVLAEDVGARETVDLLGDTGSVIDVRIYVWMREAERWRLLTLAEQKALWQFRRSSPAVAGASKE